MEENFVERPEGKPIKSFRARVKMYGNDVVVVNPQAQGESNRRVIKRKGNSSFYKSEGEKESSYSVHINVDANDPDPVGTMQEIFADITRDERKQEPKLPTTARYIHESERVKIWKSARRKKVCLLVEMDSEVTKAKLLSQFWKEMTTVNQVLTNSAAI